MAPDRRNQISDLYHAALQRAPEERCAFLDAACDGDELLRHEIESLLAVEPSASQFLERPALEVVFRGPTTIVGRQLGCYRFLAPLGAGGMGEVYRARDTRLERDVAIKILPSHFTEDAERRIRFAREARVLATLNHPHIGAIYGLEEADGVTALVPSRPGSRMRRASPQSAPPRARRSRPGITAYGFVPVVIPFEDEGRVHGNDERISIENVRRGATMMLEIARRVSAK